MRSSAPPLCVTSSITRLIVGFAFYALFVAPSFAEEPKALEEPIDFARQRLSDPNEWIRSLSLNVVARLNPQAERERLLQALDDPSAEVRSTAIVHLKSMPLGKASTKVRSILEKTSNEVDATLSKDAAIVDSFLTLEYDSVEALLTAGDDTDRKVAQDYIRKALNDDRSVTRWELMADLVGEHRLRELAPLLRKPLNPQIDQVTVASNLAKLGDQEAIKSLRTSLNAERSLSHIISDSELVKILGLTLNDIRPHLQGGPLYLKLAAAMALGRLGDHDGLHALTKELLAGRLDHDSIEVLYAIGEAGDETSLPSLKEYFSGIKGESPNEIQLKLLTALAVADIIARESKKTK